ncbi:14 kDa proline-rich protein DC2.15-like [Cornus florida]|uniref:14 kDa proline-rich protein DC2.15-like n=1 Tax=Cornus florida TaxID=4283 RepID=UPI00289D8E05|nr:14 kDa proline-rich protein DC2.15-like [Cornus florida]
MASKSLASTVLLLSLNIIFFCLITSIKVTGFLSPKTSEHHRARPQAKKTCPENVLKFGVCGGLMNYLMHFEVGKPPMNCCKLMNGMFEFEAAVCLCMAMKANIMGFNMNIPFAMTLILDFCGKKTPPDYKCK